MVSLNEFEENALAFDAKRFSISQLKCAQLHTLNSAFEWFLVGSDSQVTIETGGLTIPAKGNVVAILPAGETAVFVERGEVYALFVRKDRGEPEAHSYRGTKALPRLYDMDKLEAPADNPRLKMLQTTDLSLNWVCYDGPRDRSRLSPHKHERFEQGSLAIKGQFTHHLRTLWGNNANAWQDDQHVEAGARSAIFIPPGVIHTTEGVGEGPHLLIDFFSPPRADFRAKGWFANSDDYQRSDTASEIVIY